MSFETDMVEERKKDVDDTYGSNKLAWVGC
jgi:hypothetical protein